ncbi:hypothetical protein ZIOFF_040647 [Zingiber officinale]|uniref:Major facilitator superfamily (MFS) profile domain-containing protein n=1 Tax=Zingiber officinale TaxID=94328 RepID=A0A8J5GHS7_ZINOF|nr:hypothetical protein ZIOFF_040647 [Zingiber officinale]
MMQSAMFAAAKGCVPGLESPSWRSRVSPGVGPIRKTRPGSNRLSTADAEFCCGSSPLRSSITLRVEMARSRSSVEGIFRSREKARYVKVQSTGGLDDLPSDKLQKKTSGNVIPYVGVACLGAILFGYHLAVVNGALEYLAKDLGITKNTVLQGWVVSITLAGATIGSFTGGALADKFGRTRSFQLDAIPLAIGAFLSAIAQDVRTMIIGRLLAGIGIGISSAIVPLYISEVADFISPTEIRGALGSINQLFICIGILVALVAGLPLSGNPLCIDSQYVCSSVHCVKTRMKVLPSFSMVSEVWKPVVTHSHIIHEPLLLPSQCASSATAIRASLSMLQCPNVVDLSLSASPIASQSCQLLHPHPNKRMLALRSNTTMGLTMWSSVGSTSIHDQQTKDRLEADLQASPVSMLFHGVAMQWRTMFTIAIFPSVLMAVGMAFCPESPRWLFQQGKFSQAETAIRKLYGKEQVADVMHELRSGGEGSTEPDAGWFDLFSKRYWKVVSVGAALFLFQQLAGINAVVYYSTSVFRSAGIASDVAASALVGASNVFGTAVASSLMDKRGRKSLLITSFSGMAASMLLLSLSFSWKPLAPYSGTLAVVGTVLHFRNVDFVKLYRDRYVLSFSLGAGPVPALLLPEIFASRIRAKAVALSLGMHWISNFVIGLYFLSVVQQFGISRVYLGFAGVCTLAVLYITGNVVETKGRSLEEIERALSAEV